MSVVSQFKIYLIIHPNHLVEDYCIHKIILLKTVEIKGIKQKVLNIGDCYFYKSR